MTIRYKRPDIKNAQSIIESAEREMKFTMSLETMPEAGSTIIRNIYECFRKLGDALLVAEGIETHDHLEPLKALMKIQVEVKRPIGVIENLRQMRHNINYYGYRPKTEEVNDAIDIAKKLFEPLYREVKKKVSVE